MTCGLSFRPRQAREKSREIFSRYTRDDMGSLTELVLKAAEVFEMTWMWRHSDGSISQRRIDLEESPTSVGFSHYLEILRRPLT